MIPAMENASLDDQQGETVHGIRDITNTAEVNWSELARASQDELKGRKRYIMHNCQCIFTKLWLACPNTIVVVVRSLCH